MKKLFAVLLAVIMTVQVYCQDKETKNFTSYWEGSLKISAISLKLALKIYKNDDGSQGAFMDSPDQSATNIPVGSITLTDDSLKFDVPSKLCRKD